MNTNNANLSILENKIKPSKDLRLKEAWALNFSRIKGALQITHTIYNFNAMSNCITTAQNYCNCSGSKYQVRLSLDYLKVPPLLICPDGYVLNPANLTKFISFPTQEKG